MCIHAIVSLVCKLVGFTPQEREPPADEKTENEEGSD